MKRLLLLATMAAGWLFLRRRQQETGASTSSTASTLSTGSSSSQLSSMSGAGTTSVTTDQDAPASGQLVDDVVVVGSSQAMSETYMPSTDDASGGSPGHVQDQQSEMVTQAYDTSTQFEAVPAEPDRADAAEDSSSEGILLPPDTQPVSVADTQGGEQTSTATGSSVSEDAAPTYLFSGTSEDEAEQEGRGATSSAGTRAPHPHHVDVSQGETVVFRPQHEGGDGSDHVRYDHDSGDAVSTKSGGETGSGSGVLMSSEEHSAPQSEYHSDDAADFDPIGMDVTPPKSDISEEDYKHVEVSLPPETLAAIGELEQSGGRTETTEHHIEEGYSVEAVDGSVGTVEKVERGANDAESYMHVKKGLLFKSDVSIPISAVERVENDTVYLNIEKQYIKLIEGDDTKEIGEDNLNIRY